MTNRTEGVQAFPLAWPTTWIRTKEEDRQRARFKTTFGTARDGVVRELRLMGVDRTQIVISSNVPLRKDGLPYATRQKYDDPGVAVYFVLNDKQVCIPCDRWTTVEDNLRAIEKTVEALRGLRRWGADRMVEAAFHGFEALPEQVPTAGWWHVLNVDRYAAWEEIERQYRELVKVYHPDKGGNVEMFHVVQDAYAMAQQERDPINAAR